MKLYHGSIEQVKTPEIRESDHTLDYGKGFYATTSIEQAENWVKRKAKEMKVSQGYVNEYEFDESAIRKMKSLIFYQPTEEWVDFVHMNRTKKGFQHDYDIVYGPVANDRVYAAFALYEGGVLDKQELIKELRTYKLVDQYLFHTTSALKYLSFIEAKEVVL
jgi:hypothetical protein